MSLTNVLAIDCEMVGAGPKGRKSIAARVSVVNEYGECVFDAYIRPTRKVTDYRTFVSGITASHLAQGQPFKDVKRKVAGLIKNRILVGHSVDKDLKALGICHPEWNVRDTAQYPPYRTRRGSSSLKSLAQKYLGLTIQTGSHSSVQDARATMKLYKIAETEWEEWLDQSESDSESESESESDYSESESD